MTGVNYYYSFILSLITGLGYITACDNKDCSTQAGVPCDIISSTTKCPKKIMSGEPFGSQLMTVNIQPVPNNKSRVGLNISWAHLVSPTNYVHGYEVQYWDYAEASKTNGSLGVLDLCVNYNFTSSQKPTNGTILHHSCIDTPTRVIKVLALPQKNSEIDYVHRITSGYPQDYGGESAKWQPSLIVMHNDSCNGVVEVQLYLAPEKFNFNHYILQLRTTDGRTKMEKEIFPDPTDVTASVIFTKVPDGNFEVVVIPEPYNANKCTSNGYSFKGCVMSITSAFLMSENHPKCWQETITTEPNFSPDDSELTTNLVLIIILSCTGVLAVILITLTLLILRKEESIAVFCKNIPCKDRDALSDGRSIAMASVRSGDTNKIRRNNDYCSEIIKFKDPISSITKDETYVDMEPSTANDEKKSVNIEPPMKISDSDDDSFDYKIQTMNSYNDEALWANECDNIDSELSNSKHLSESNGHGRLLLVPGNYSFDAKTISGTEI